MPFVYKDGAFEEAQTPLINVGETVRKLGCSQHEKMVDTSG